MATEIQIRTNRGRTIDKFLSDIEATDEIMCIALLRRRAKDLRRNVEELSIRAKLRGRWYEYRA